MDSHARRGYEGKLEYTCSIFTCDRRSAWIGGGHYCGSDDPLLQLGLGRSVGQCDCCSACIDKWVACDKRCRSCIDGGTPKNVEIDAVIKTIESIPGVNNMHDLHVWSITSGQNALSCHVVVDGTISIQESQEILRTIEDELEDENIGHATIQMESENHPHKDSVMCRDDDITHSHEH